jgi:hypothetical protein
MYIRLAMHSFAYGFIYIAKGAAWVVAKRIVEGFY